MFEERTVFVREKNFFERMPIFGMKNGAAQTFADGRGDFEIGKVAVAEFESELAAQRAEAEQGAKHCRPLSLAPRANFASRRRWMRGADILRKRCRCRAR